MRFRSWFAKSYFIAASLLAACFFLSVSGVCADAIGNDSLDEFDAFEADIQQQLQAAQVPDPIEPFNRAMFWVNDKLYFLVLKPVGSGYKTVVPKPARLCVDRFFDNLQFPLRVTNNSLQGKWRGAGAETQRFVINTTVGLLGLFDPALNRWDIEPRKEDFGQTFARYGAGPGFIIHLPVWGPSNLRDAIGKIPAIFVDPLYYLDPWEARLGARATDTVNMTSLKIGLYEDLKADSVDPYQLMQDIYQQNREKQIKE